MATWWNPIFTRMFISFSFHDNIFHMTRMTVIGSGVISHHFALTFVTRHRILLVAALTLPCATLELELILATTQARTYTYTRSLIKAEFNSQQKIIYIGHM